MKAHPTSKSRGFTLLETVIAIGVLAVLLTGFIAVFAPAADGIRRSISIQEADRLSSMIEQELSTRRGNENQTYPTHFDKAMEWIRESHGVNDALVVYQYRASLTQKRTDGTSEPIVAIEGESGRDYIVQPMLRRLNDPSLTADLQAVEGNIFIVKCTQLVNQNNAMEMGSPGQILSSDGTAAANATNFDDAVITFAAQFYSLPAKTSAYLTGPSFRTRFPSLKNPLFVRNLAVRR